MSLVTVWQNIAPDFRNGVHEEFGDTRRRAFIRLRVPTTHEGRRRQAEHVAEYNDAIGWHDSANFEPFPPDVGAWLDNVMVGGLLRFCGIQVMSVSLRMGGKS